MATRLHAASVYAVKYSSGVFSAFESKDLNRVILELCDNEGVYDANDDNVITSRSIYVSVTAWEKMMEKVGNMADKELWDEYHLLHKSEGVKATAKELAEGFKYIYENSAKGDGYIHLSWY